MSYDETMFGTAPPFSLRKPKDTKKKICLLR